jgi:hypothetical protein
VGQIKIIHIGLGYAQRHFARLILAVPGFPANARATCGSNAIRIEQYSPNSTNLEIAAQKSQRPRNERVPADGRPALSTGFNSNSRISLCRLFTWMPSSRAASP